MILEVNHLTKSFGDLAVLQDLSLDFSGEGIYCIFGPSGCGKTTLLNLLTGLITPDAGERIGFANRRFSYIFQEERLLPWATVAENVNFVLGNLDKEEIAKRVESVLEIVEMKDFATCYPHELSGGMKQRVAIARAVAYAGDLLIMDEPFKGLHLELKKTLMGYIREYLKEQRRIGILVTHQVEEVLYLADHVYMVEGPPMKVSKAFTINVPHVSRATDDSSLTKYRKLIFNTTI